ncbi:MAG TPA: Mut7-C RNAse domain-containing protein [Candidatus Binatus sp.]|uniref:Mut7-C RNAse domain-containing protein n=1 Tax=Candidatus Binatus sp. TaxID=2811406 RepID=UPI002B491D8B|nr:Mut7-C RNAse domain-containing protein [Candidatus Binatus sp.]HKN12590.1 Mut7-C RNAse domain-containing protein [Candidatus Binatus sp.]
MDETPRLAVDRMLMRLARWLRLLGVDVIADASLTGAELLRIARADNRILLTRDKRLRTASDVFFVESNAIRGQLREAVRRFGLDPRVIPLTRCSRCNLVLTPVARDLVSRRVPPYVFASHDRFAECAGCGRIYWAETHPVRMHAMLDSIAL